MHRRDATELYRGVVDLFVAEAPPPSCAGAAC
jgi:hypothetical protein